MKIKLFILPTCPYCIQALKMIETLKQETPSFQQIEIEIIDESEDMVQANQYDYYYVPSFYHHQQLLHEGAINFNN